MRIHRNYILILIVIFIYTSNYCWGQEIIRTINLSENEEIQEIKSNQLYTAVFTYTSFKSAEEAYKVCLYDKSGKEVFKKTLFEQIPGSVFFDNNHENIIIVMNGGVPGSGIIKSIKINTETINWTASSNASRYVISPDGKKLLTALPPIDSKAQLQIIDLKTGSVENINIGNNYYGAEWFDKDRIITCNRITAESSGLNERKPGNEIDEISAELARLAKLLKENRIEKDKYNKQVKELIDKRRNLISNTPTREDLLKERTKLSLSEIIKKRKSQISKFNNDKKFELVLYNRKTGIVEKRIPMIINNAVIKMPYEGYDINPISIDKNQNIFVSGSLNKKRHLIQYNKEFQFIKSFPIDKYSMITRFKIGDDYIFREINRQRETKILDEEIGKFREILDSDQLPKEIKEQRELQSHYTISKHYEILNDSKTLLIKKMGSEK